MMARSSAGRRVLQQAGQHDAGGGDAGQARRDLSLPIAEVPLDAASASLSDALRLSFRLLKISMLVLVGAYFFSGGGCVQPDEQLVVLRFGKITGAPLGPGFHFSLPYPIDERILVPVRAPKREEIRLFWIRVREEDKGKEIDELSAGGSTLDPVADGALLTGDKNLIHLLVQVTYTIADAAAYVSNVVDESELVRSATESSMIAVVAGQEVDGILRGQSTDTISLEVRRRLQRRLDALETGLRVEIVSVESKTPPLQVRRAFTDVQRAESVQLQTIEEARTLSSKTLNAAAGAAHEIIYAKIQEYERARDGGEEERAEVVRQELIVLLSDRATGEAARLIQEAQTYRENVVQEVDAEVRRFQQLLPTYRSNPAFLVATLWLETQKTILSNKRVEKYFVGNLPDEIRLLVTENPQGKRELEEEEIARKERVGR